MQFCFVHENALKSKMIALTHSNCSKKKFSWVLNSVALLNPQVQDSKKCCKMVSTSLFDEVWATNGLKTCVAIFQFCLAAFAMLKNACQFSKQKFHFWINGNGKCDTLCVSILASNFLSEHWCLKHFCQHLMATVALTRMPKFVNCLCWVFNCFVVFQEKIGLPTIESDFVLSFWRQSFDESFTTKSVQ